MEDGSEASYDMRQIQQHALNAICSPWARLPWWTSERRCNVPRLHTVIGIRVRVWPRPRNPGSLMHRRRNLHPC